MNALDYGIIGIIGISVIFAMLRGFIREVASLISWVAAFIVTGKFYDELATRLTFVDDPIARKVISIIIIFVLTLFIVGMVSSYISSFVSKAGLSGIDRLLGMFFGALRGVLIICALMGLLQILIKMHLLVFVTDTNVWQESVFIPELQRLVNWFFANVVVDQKWPVGV